LGRKSNSQQNFQQIPLNTSRSLSVVPGSGWWMGYEPGLGFCDGSAVSTCKRDDDLDCLLYSHNDAKGFLMGDALSGWLVMKIDNVKEGLILAKIQWWIRNNVRTQEWTEVNNGGNNPNNRSLGGHVVPLPDDFKFELAINGKIETWDHNKYMEHTKEMAYNEAIFPFMDDPEQFQNEDEGVSVEVAIRVLSEKDPRGATIAITHLYYA